MDFISIFMSESRYDSKNHILYIVIMQAIMSGYYRTLQK
ncbi:hypothetical protein J415_07750 [Klebsiella michiganensis HKOPL1]|nr:hypothetical protein A225_4860 [Klebsiella michiganensis E718]AHW87087.1 hypothetical protein J415_07750 [Klebsiella michiganensis HKOPL1]